MSGFLEGLEEAHGAAAQASEVFRAAAGLDPAAVLSVGPVDEVVNAFDAPVPAVDGQYPLRRGLLRCATRHPQRDLTRVLAGFVVEGSTLDQKDLTDVGDVEVRIERRTAPNAPRLNATVIGWRDRDEVGRTALVEQQRDIAMQRRWVALGGERLMRLALDDIGCQRALGQQRIAGDVLASEVTALKHGERQADFVGALLRIAARYG